MKLRMAWRGLWLMLALGGGLMAVAGCTTAERAALAGDKDHALARSVMDRLSQEILLDRASISATSRGGVVTLRGVVRSEVQRARAVAIARATSGVTEVVDQLREY